MFSPTRLPAEISDVILAFTTCEMIKWFSDYKFFNTEFKFHESNIWGLQSEPSDDHFNSEKGRAHHDLNSRKNFNQQTVMVIDSVMSLTLNQTDCLKTSPQQNGLINYLNSNTTTSLNSQALFMILCNNCLLKLCVWFLKQLWPFA